MSLLYSRVYGAPSFRSLALVDLPRKGRVMRGHRPFIDITLCSIDRLVSCISFVRAFRTDESRFGSVMRIPYGVPFGMNELHRGKTSTATRSSPTDVPPRPCSSSCTIPRQPTQQYSAETGLCFGQSSGPFAKIVDSNNQRQQHNNVVVPIGCAGANRTRCVPSGGAKQ
jgi:hypothetical protein